jgi:hypothetical protein
MNHGTSYVFGMADPLPLRGFPLGKIKTKIRAGVFAKVFVKTPSGIWGFYVKEVDGLWLPGPGFGRNESRPMILCSPTESEAKAKPETWCSVQSEEEGE